MNATTHLDAPARSARVARADVRTQLTLMVSQLAAGAGNLVVSVVAARLLAPAAYAQVVSFLALYLVVHVPAAALVAATSVDPAAARRVRRSALLVSAVAAAFVVIASGPISGAANLPVAMVLSLAVALPGAALLGLARGESSARHDVSGLAWSFLAEPVVRAGLGLVLMLVFGATGAAVAAVAGGYAAVAICRRRSTDRDRLEVDHVTTRAHPIGPTGVTHWSAVGVGVSFVFLAVFVVVDVVLSNVRLDGLDAGRFGALSTIGGAAVFATATVPLVLLPASARGDDQARRLAVRIALGTGALIAAVGWLAARPILGVAVGPELAGASGWLGPYLIAMASVGVARVLVATRWTQGDGGYALRAVIVALCIQILAVLALGTSVGAVVLCTVATAVGLTVALTLPPIHRPVVVPRLAAERRIGGLGRSTWAMIGFVAVAVALRAATTRGLWVDEAISVRQARQPFGKMLDDVRTSDVHPPLHHALLWVTTRVAGASEFAVRLPSLLAGVALVPAIAWTGRVLYDRRTGWIAAAFAVVAPFSVWYSQEARMYSLFMLFATIAVGAQVQAVRRGARIDWIVYSAATAAMIWTQYFAVFPVAVQQLAFVAVWFRRRRDTTAVRRLLRGWLPSVALIALATLPLLPILVDQINGYSNRSSGLVPGQAGAGNSDLDGAISVYTVAANLVWGIWGYHSDGTMLLLTAFWPLVMLLVLVLLGRGRSDRTFLLIGLVVVPLTALFVVGSMKRDLFELRYFSGGVPALLLLAARLVTVTTRAPRAAAAAAAVAVASLTTGLVDQQLNGANPRLYDFQGAIEVVDGVDASDDAVLFYAPEYLGDVISYYAPDLDIRPLGAPVPDGASTVWVLASERVLNAEATAARVGAVLSDIEQERTLIRVVHRPNVRVWELR